MSSRETAHLLATKTGLELASTTCILIHPRGQ